MPKSRLIYNRKYQRLNILEWVSETPNAPICLFLHGLSNNAAIWHSIADNITPYYQMVALDFRGHGDSDWDPDHAYTHNDFIDDLHYCIASLNLKHIHLIGHSLGARVAALYLQQYGADILSFTIIDTGPNVKSGASNKIKDDMNAMPRVFSSPDNYLALLSKIYILSQPSELAQMAQHDLRQRTDGSWELKFDHNIISALWSSNTEQGNNALENKQDSLWEAFTNILVPSLVIRGKVSAVLGRRTAQEMTERMPNATLATIERAGHAVMTDNPTEVSKVIVRFLEQIAATA
ncbi:MAG: alpha/beta hydrolase [Pseudomonadota bacterium]